MATINLNNALKFLREREEKTKAEAIRMSADPSLRGLPSTGAHIDPSTGKARVGTVAPAPAGADPFVKTKHGFFARNYATPGTQGQGGVSMGATYPRPARSGRGYGESIGVMPPRVGGSGFQHWDRGVTDAGLPGTIAGTTPVPQVPRVAGGGSRVSDPMNTRPGTFMGSLHHPPYIAGMGGRAAPQPRRVIMPDRNILPRQPNQRVPSLQQPQFAGRHPPVMRWDAGQMRLPNQRAPSKAQVTITQEQGKPDKRVTKYDIGQEDTVGVADQGRASSEYQIQGMLRRAMANSARQDRARSAGVSMQEIPRTGYPDETIQVSPGDVQIIPRVRPQDVQVIPRGTSYPGGSYGDSLPPIKGFASRVSGGDVRQPNQRVPDSAARRESTDPNLPEQPIWNPELEAQIKAYLAGKKSIGERLSDAGLGRSAAMRQAYERRPRYGLQSQRGWDRQAPFPNPYYNFYGMLGGNEY